MSIKAKKMRIIENMCMELQTNPQHKCYDCAFGLGAALKGTASESLSETTIDANACEFFYEDYLNNDEWCVAEDGNTRCSLSGFRTEDNGAGYWVTECPYQVRIFGKAV